MFLVLQRKLWEMRSHESTQGATAPNFENCRKCACAFCGVSAAAPKQASCSASPAARPMSVPRQIGKAALRHGKARKVEGREGRALSRPQCQDEAGPPPSKNFPVRQRRFSNPVRRGEAARLGCGRMVLAAMRRHQGRRPAQRGDASVSLLRRGSAMNTHSGDC